MNKRFVREFAKPPNEFSPAPLWFWYGKLEKEELSRQIDEMIDKGVYNAFMHARAYLVTPYLEEEWWDIIDHVMAYSEQKGFHPWIYDEYAWPSGTAGSTFKYSKQKPSRVLAEGERNMAKSLRYTSHDFEGPVTIELSQYQQEEAPFAVIMMKLDDDGNIVDASLTDLSENAKNGTCSMNEAGHFRIIFFYRYTIRTAVDYLNKDAVKSFIRYTHEAYKERYGKYFGKRIPGVFFDEIYNAADKIVWTNRFEEEFLNRKGYDIKRYLPLLLFDGGGLTPKIRSDYYDIVTALYEEAFFIPISKWCDENNLMLTGHTEESLSQHPLRQGDYFRTMRHLHIPGGDCHDYRYKYPRKITPVEPKGAVSVARLYGKTRVMSEAMGGGGWATTLQEFKRGINVLAAMGINFFVLHGFYYETEHQGSQGDWPASFFFQNPYWENFKVFSDYISRLSLMGSIGKPVCKVGLLYPITLIQQKFRDGRVDKSGERITHLYHSALDTLLSNQLDVDIIDEESLLRATVEDGQLCAGAEAFEVILLPDSNGLGESVLQKLKAFEEQGGHILLYDCGSGNSIRSHFLHAVVLTDLNHRLVNEVKQVIELDFEIIEGDRTDIFYYHRVQDDLSYFLLVNACDKVKAFTASFAAMGRPILFNIETGACSEIEEFTVTENQRTCINMTLLEDEACFIVFSEKNTTFTAGLTGFGEKTIDDRMRTLSKKAAGDRVPALSENAADCGLSELNNKVCNGKEESCDFILNLDRNWTIVPTPKGSISEEAAKETVIEIPIALFRSGLHEKWKDIRIQNREGEAGSCGRHLSSWKASWITRRPSWTDGSGEKILYFRKTVEIPEKVEQAKLCIAAVNKFRLFINGKLACSGSGWRIPSECDVSEYFKTGKNLIAVCLENDTPVQGNNILEAESFDPDALTSLLVEGWIDTASSRIELCSDSSWITCAAFIDGWEKAELNAEENAQRIDVKSIGCPWGLEHPEKWIYAWERGAPPILPWGRLPLFSQDVEFPLEIKYKITIPSGTQKVFKPVVNGDFSAQLDGQAVNPALWDKGFIEGIDIKHIHTLCVTVRAMDFTDGLVEPIRVAMTASACNLGDWRKTGLPFYSGSMIYQNSFELDQTDDIIRCELDLGQVNFHAEVWVNEQLAGTRLWKPYWLDITDFIQSGMNQLTISVSNLAANKMRYSLLDEGEALGWNRYWYEDNIDRDAQNLESGLFGPVTVRLTRKS